MFTSIYSSVVRVLTAVLVVLVFTTSAIPASALVLNALGHTEWGMALLMIYFDVISLGGAV